MQDKPSSKSDDETDIRELFLMMWAYKLFIASTCVIGIVLSSYYALNTVKKFTSEAIFKLGDNVSNNNILGGQLSALASLSGFSGATGATSSYKDLVTGRIFIENLEPKLNFQADRYFNTYNPNVVDPAWKSMIKKAIGWQKSSADTQEAIWQSIVDNYSKNIAVGKTKDGSLKIVVTHVKAQRAADIANVIMNEIILASKNKKNTEQDEQLFYLSNTLAKALSDLELTQSNLKEFTLKNSALPLESFAAGSLQLDSLRDQLSRTSKLHEAVAALSVTLQNKTTGQNDYIALRKKFPIIDQVEFRRVLGQNEIISSWSWPDANSVDAVFDTLSERKNRLQTQINASQINAERSSLALETFAKLEREANIADATYTVLIEQVKSRSMAAGFRPDRTEVYEYASASINPSEPNRKIILILGAFLGIFVGAGLSLISALRRGVYYSTNSLKKGVQARFEESIRSLLPLRNKSLNVVNTMLAKKPRTILRSMAVEIHKSSATQIVVTSSRAKLKGIDVAHALASYMQSDIVKIAMINFSSTTKKLDIDNDRLILGSFVVSESVDHVSILRPDGDLATMELLSQKDFWDGIQLLNSTFDLVFLSADGGDAISLLSALEGQKMFHITLARTKKTKTSTLWRMRSLLPIQGLLHD